MPERYEDDRLYCGECHKQPELFHEVIEWQVNVVRPNGQLVDTGDKSVRYVCPQCGNTADWGNKVASW